jgi:hypothetical protein
MINQDVTLETFESRVKLSSFRQNSRELFSDSRDLVKTLESFFRTLETWSKLSSVFFGLSRLCQNPRDFGLRDARDVRDATARVQGHAEACCSRREHHHGRLEPLFPISTQERTRYCNNNKYDNNNTALYWSAILRKVLRRGPFDTGR